MEHIDINKSYWNKRVEEHYKSDFYNVEAFIHGQSSLNAIELELLPELKGKSVLHLQCHFGQDTLSLARMGAEVTGVDFSEDAIDKANALKHQLNVEASFICSDIYSLPASLYGKFDVVFASYGVIGWHPDASKWFNVASKCLKKGGEIVFVEFHPVVWMFDDDFIDLKYSYFNKQAIVETETGAYTNRDANIEASCVTWNHSLSDVITAVLGNSFSLCALKEYDYSPYNCFNNTVKSAENTYRIQGKEEILPMVYALKACKL